MPPVFIGKNPVLEAVYEDTGSDTCVIITHPHSLMGGNMHNNVVMAAWKASLDKGLSALRFNFRGVGRSGGSFDEGDGEMSDLACAIHHVEKHVIIVGYSFGSWVAARLIKRLESPPPCIFISPPTAMFTFPPLMNETVLALAGGSDQFCSIPALEAVMKRERIEVLSSIDHFWFGDEDTLIPLLSRSLETLLHGSDQPA